jgi:hypothetical protein
VRCFNRTAILSDKQLDVSIQKKFHSSAPVGRFRSAFAVDRHTESRSAAHARCFQATSAIFELKMPHRTIRPVKPKDAAERDDGQSCGIVVGRLNLRIWRLLGKLAGLRQKRPTLGGMAVYSRRRSGRLFNVRPDTAALRSNHWAQSRRQSNRYARPAR